MAKALRDADAPSPATPTTGSFTPQPQPQPDSTAQPPPEHAAEASATDGGVDDSSAEAMRAKLRADAESRVARAQARQKKMSAAKAQALLKTGSDAATTQAVTEAEAAGVGAAPPRIAVPQSEGPVAELHERSASGSSSDGADGGELPPKPTGSAPPSTYSQAPAVDELPPSPLPTRHAGLQTPPPPTTPGASGAAPGSELFNREPVSPLGPRIAQPRSSTLASSATPAASLAAAATEGVGAAGGVHRLAATADEGSEELRRENESLRDQLASSHALVASLRQAYRDGADPSEVEGGLSAVNASAMGAAAGAAPVDGHCVRCNQPLNAFARLQARLTRSELTDVDVASLELALDAAQQVHSVPVPLPSCPAQPTRAQLPSTANACPAAQHS